MHNEAEALIEENRVERAIVEHLSKQSVPLSGLLRVQRGLQAHLPPQLWIKRIDVGGVGGSARRKDPGITIDGGGKEINGVEVNEVYLDFYGKFKAELEAAGATVGVTTPGVTTSTLNFTIKVQFGEGD